MEWERFAIAWWRRAAKTPNADPCIATLGSIKIGDIALKSFSGDWRIVGGAAAAVGLAGGYALYRRFHRLPSTEEVERRRRLRINQIGRIVEGQVTQLIEAPATPVKSGFLRPRPRTNVASASSGRKLVCYSYSISGVTYETAQDVTGLEERLRLNLLAVGQSASVKYNPSNPSDSIVVADDWSGVH